MKRKKTKKETKKIQSENNTYLLLAKYTQHIVKRFQTNKEVVLKEPKNAFAYFMFQKLLPNSSEICFLKKVSKVFCPFSVKRGWYI